MVLILSCCPLVATLVLANGKIPPINIVIFFKLNSSVFFFQKGKALYITAQLKMYGLRHSHLNHHLKGEDSREDIIQILENLNHRIRVGINPVTDAAATHPLCPVRNLIDKLSTHPC